MVSLVPFRWRSYVPSFGDVKLCHPDYIVWILLTRDCTITEG
jgi:hypothetical protein